jgi:3-phenylpropionate/trans-cinnamate dioxygenase ferredoxin reductase subunit
MSLNDIVIVGAGEAGGRAALALRAAGFAGRIALVGEETHPPYERPPLSKAAITDAGDPAPVVIGDGGRLAELGVERIAGVAALAIDRRARKLELADGRALAYDALVLATGARALPLPGAELALTLRTFEDALRIRERIHAARRVAVVGGGFIGLEIAASARALGREVTLLEADSRLLRRSTPEPLAATLEARHAAEGVEIVKSVRIERIEATARGFVIHTSAGAREADVVVAGVGAAPRVELAQSAGLAADNGVVVDGCLRTGDPAIYAIGDCACFPHPSYDGRRLRLEAWRNAFDQGVHVAKALLGEAEPFAASPWFWSDQYDLTLQMVGVAEAAARVIARDLDGGAQMLFHLDAQGRLAAAGGLGKIEKIAKEIKLAERLIARRAVLSAAALADQSASLKKML